MSDAADHLRRWRAAGLLDEDTADGIAAFERDRPPPAAVSSAPSVVEGIVYLGLAAIGVGMVVLAAVNWEHLGTAGRIAIAGGSAALTLVLGRILLQSARPQLVRGGAMAWLLTVALVTLAVGITADESDWGGENAFLAVGATALVSAAALWSLSRREAQLIALTGGLLLFSFSLGARLANENDQPASGGMVLFAFALFAILLTESAVLRPRYAARVLFSAAAVLGAFLGGAAVDGPAWAELFAIPLGAGLIGLSLRRATLTYMVAGVASVFLGLATVILRHVDDPTVAALAMILIGVVLVSGVLVLARYRPWRR